MTMQNVEYRLAQDRDFTAIVRLNEANFVKNLNESEREDGFLSAIFSLEQIVAMASDLGITIANVDGVLAGFLCAFRNDFDHGSPVVAKMIEAYPHMLFESRPLSEWRTYVYGPVCIDRRFRRSGLLRGLYTSQLRSLAGQFEVGVALISRNNPHSMAAHLAGLGMIETGDFAISGNVFATVAFRVPKSPTK